MDSNCIPSNATIYCYKNSTAHSYAKKNGNDFVLFSDEQEDIPADGTIGDVNGDGKVNVKDATAIQKHVADITAIDADILVCADTDHDGKITVKDATRIQKFVAGIITEL